MRTNFNHILHVEDDLAESIKENPNMMEQSTPIVLMEIAKALCIIADTLENIERRLTDAKNSTSDL